MPGSPPVSASPTFTHIGNFPSEIIQRILFFLPDKDKIRLRRVSLKHEGFSRQYLLPDFFQAVRNREVKHIVECRSHLLLQRADGTLWAAGDNSYGKLGIGVDDSTNTLKKVIWRFYSGDTRVKSIAAGWDCNIVLKVDGTVWTWVVNKHGELRVVDHLSEYNGTDHYVFPAEVQNLVNVQSIASSKNHTLVLRVNGDVWAWGPNGNGELGLGDTYGRTRPCQLGIGLLPMQQVAAGAGHSLALAKNDTVWAWGRNREGQLGLGNNAPFLMAPQQITD